MKLRRERVQVATDRGFARRMPDEDVLEHVEVGMQGKLSRWCDLRPRSRWFMKNQRPMPAERVLSFF